MTDGEFSQSTIRHDGWTIERQLEFIKTLARTGSVERAASEVGMSVSSAYRARGRLRNEAFGYGWRAAQEMAYARLRELALERIENGVSVATTHKGEVVAVKTIFSDRLLVAMLQHLKPAEGTLGPNGLRRPADDPGRDYATVLDAYAAAIDTGSDPENPANSTLCSNGCKPPPKRMTREEFIAVIRSRAKTVDVEKLSSSA